MKLLGLIGGLSWISTIDYYREINQTVGNCCGGLHSATILLHSIDFEEFSSLLKTAKYDKMAVMLSRIALGLENAGAAAVIICANTPHIVAEEVQANINIPLIHIADATADQILRQKLKKVALLGTKTTMEQSFFVKKLTEKQLVVITPGSADRQFIHDAVFNELAKGLFYEATKTRFVHIVNELINKGAEGIILGCTEFPYVLKQEELPIPLFNTATLHAGAAARFSLNL